MLVRTDTYMLGMSEPPERLPMGTVELPPVSHGGREVKPLTMEKRACRDNQYPEADALKLVNDYYRAAHYAADLRGKDNVYLAAPSTRGANTLPFRLAQRLAADFGGRVLNIGKAVARAEAKNKKEWLSKVADPSRFDIEPGLADAVWGKNVVLVDDIHTSGETAMGLLADLKAAGVTVNHEAVLRAKDGGRRANLTDYDRVARELAPKVGLKADTIRKEIKVAYPETYAIFLKRAAEQAETKPREVYDAIRRQAEAVRAHARATGAKGAGDTQGVRGPADRTGVSGLAAREVGGKPGEDRGVLAAEAGGNAGRVNRESGDAQIQGREQPGADAWGSTAEPGKPAGPGELTGGTAGTLKRTTTEDDTAHGLDPVEQ